MDTKNIDALITSLRSETHSAAITPEILGGLLQKIAELLKSSAEQYDVEDFKKAVSALMRKKMGKIVEIKCETREDILYVPGGYLLKTAGFVPYVFRYSTMQCRMTDRTGHYRAQKGWHVFHGCQKLDITKDDQILFYDFKESKKQEGFDSSGSGLFDTIRYGYDGNMRPTFFKVAFGKKTYDCMKHPRRFKFAIGFAPAQRRGFDFSSLITNLAEFQVLVRWSDELDDAQFKYSL